MTILHVDRYTAVLDLVRLPVARAGKTRRRRSAVEAAAAQRWEPSAKVLAAVACRRFWRVASVRATPHNGGAKRAVLARSQ